MPVGNAEQYSAAVTVDHGAPEALPEQLAEILRAQIESGELPPRTKLMPQFEMVSTTRSAGGQRQRPPTCWLTRAWSDGSKVAGSGRRTPT